MKYTFAARQQPKSERGVQKSVCEEKQIDCGDIMAFSSRDGRLRLCCAAAAVAAEKGSQ
jgi:uncharacterized phosphosugar-binding protein